MLALKPWLKKHGISQAHLARDVGLSPATIAQLLNHEVWPAMPDRETLVSRVARALQARGYAALDAALFKTAKAVDAAGATVLTEEVSDIQIIILKVFCEPFSSGPFLVYGNTKAEGFSRPWLMISDYYISP